VQESDSEESEESEGELFESEEDEEFAQKQAKFASYLTSLSLPEIKFLGSSLGVSQPNHVEDKDAWMQAILASRTAAAQSFGDDDDDDDDDDDLQARYAHGRVQDSDSEDSEGRLVRSRRGYDSEEEVSEEEDSLVASGRGYFAVSSVFGQGPFVGPSKTHCVYCCTGLDDDFDDDLSEYEEEDEKFKTDDLAELDWTNPDGSGRLSGESSGRLLELRAVWCCLSASLCCTCPYLVSFTLLFT
jgi:hypothetical protein